MNYLYKSSDMLKLRSFVLLFIGSLNTVCLMAQTFKAGDKAEAFINHQWKQVLIRKPIAGKQIAYEVQLLTGAKVPSTVKNIIRVSADQLRAQAPAVTNATAAVVTAKTTASSLHLGRYELYSGLPSMYLGHFILLADGRYRVAFDNDEGNYDETGTYLFHEDTQTIEWLGGMFKSNNWGGRFIRKEGNTYRIAFNKVTFADSGQ